MLVKLVARSQRAHVRLIAYLNVIGPAVSPSGVQVKTASLLASGLLCDTAYKQFVCACIVTQKDNYENSMNKYTHRAWT